MHFFGGSINPLTTNSWLVMEMSNTSSNIFFSINKLLFTYTTSWMILENVSLHQFCIATVSKNTLVPLFAYPQTDDTNSFTVAQKQLIELE